MKRLLDIKETATFLGLGVYTVREFVWQKRIEPIQFNRNGKLLFDIQDLEKLISENKKRARL